MHLCHAHLLRHIHPLNPPHRAHDSMCCWPLRFADSAQNSCARRKPCAGQCDILQNAIFGCRLIHAFVPLSFGPQMTEKFTHKKPAIKHKSIYNVAACVCVCDACGGVTGNGDKRKQREQNVKYGRFGRFPFWQSQLLTIGEWWPESLVV